MLAALAVVSWPASVMLADPVSASADTHAPLPPQPSPSPAEQPSAPAPQATPEVNDSELAALGFDPSAQTYDEKLEIYGFADFGYTALHFPTSGGPVPQDPRTFSVGNINLYVSRRLSSRARVLLETRFTFLPNGTLNPDGTYVNTTAQDLTGITGPTQWGGIVIERLHLEYDITDNLTIRAGRWLTPYGIWNIDHGSPVIIGTSRPFIIGQELFPEHQTGVDLFGKHYLGDFKLGFHLTASNGRGGTDAVLDQDSKLALGGRLEIETPWGLKAGVSYYRGRYTALPVAIGMMPLSYLEAEVGGDATYDAGPLHLQAEVITQTRHYPDVERASFPASLFPDFRGTGLYILGAYRFDQLWNVMPYAYYGAYHTGNLGASTGTSWDAGLNFRPTPRLVFKLQGTRVALDAAGPVPGQIVFVGSAQAACAF